MPTIHIGHLHLPLQSLFLATGLILSLLLTQRTAPLAGIAKEAMWDAGLFTAVAAFFISRLLLIATNLKIFLQHPILILSLPSVTVFGLLLTALVTAIYLRRRRQPFASVLDAATPPFTLLWAILSLGTFFTRRTGMPAVLPWAVPNPLLGPVHPVELYTASAALTLCVLLYRALPYSPRPGATAATGLFIAGALTFFLDFFAQPAAAGRIVLLDPIQWLALAMLLTGFFALLPRLQST